MGHADAEDRTLPTLLSALDDHDIVSVTCGADHTTAYSDSRLEVYSWGWSVLSLPIVLISNSFFHICPIFTVKLHYILYFENSLHYH